jgi:imidazole glycerol-phosphate synthase subunit HisF
MLKKRVIFTLLYNNGSFMLSRNFRLQKVGDLSWLKENYNFSKIAFSIDELIILDVTRGEQNEDKFYHHVRSLTEECFVPIAAGGGIRTLEQARKLLRSGADKIVINTLMYEKPDIITEISKEFGQQSIVISVDTKLVDGRFTVWTNNGSVLQKENLTSCLKNIEKLPVGELYLNSIDQDGTGQGYKVELLDYLSSSFPVPVIISGGAGKYSHFSEILKDNRVDAVATAHLFNFIGDGLEKSRKKLLDGGINLPSWDANFAINFLDSTENCSIT